LPDDWCEITAFKRLAGPPATPEELRLFYRTHLSEAFALVGKPLVSQVSRGHAILLKRWAGKFGLKFQPLLGSMAGREPIRDFGPTGGSDDEQVVMLSVQDAKRN